MPGDDDYVYHCTPCESYAFVPRGSCSTGFGSGVVQITLRYIQGSDVFMKFDSFDGIIGITLPSCSVWFINQYIYPFGPRFSAPSGTIVNMQMDLDAGIFSISLNGQPPFSVSYDIEDIQLPVHVFFDSRGPESCFQLLPDPWWRIFFFCVNDYYIYIFLCYYSIVLFLNMRKN